MATACVLYKGSLHASKGVHCPQKDFSKYFIFIVTLDH